MNLEVLNKELEYIGTIEHYTSLIWANRYNAIGDCEVYITADEHARELLKENYYLMRHNNNMVCQIKKIEIDSDTEQGDFLIVTGKDVSNIINQRIVWNQTNYSGDIQDFALLLMRDNVINPQNTKRRISNFTFSKNPEVPACYVSIQTTYDYVLDKIQEACSMHGLGYKTTYDGVHFVLMICKGTDRSAEQEENEKVIFSETNGALSASKYQIDISSIKTAALIAGEGEGNERIVSEIDNGQGIDRYELYVDARDISTTVSFEELKERFPDGHMLSGGGQTYWVDNEARTIALLLDNGDGIFHATLMTSAYQRLLKGRGNEKLAENIRKELFEFDLEQNNEYIYGEDYFLGDIVTIRNRYGYETTARVTEVIEKYDENGYSVIPSFEYFEMNDEQIAVANALLSENSELILTENNEYVELETQYMSEAATIANSETESSGKKISELEETTALNDSSVLPVVVDGETKKITHETLKTIFLIKDKIFNGLPVDPELEDNNNSGADYVMSPRSGMALYKCLNPRISGIERSIKTNVVSLKQYCVGDGETDDTEGLKKAIAENDSIYVPNGIYRLTSTVTIDKPMNITGENSQGTYFVCDDNFAAEHYSFILISSNNVYIENINFKGKNKEYAWNGVGELESAFDNIDGIRMAQIETNGDNANLVTGPRFVTIINCEIRRFRNAINMYGGWCRYIRNCLMMSNKGSAITYDFPEEFNEEQLVNTRWTGSGDIIEGCQIFCNHKGYYAKYNFQSTIWNCVFEYNETPVELIQCHDITFKNCWNEENGKIKVEGSARFEGGYNFNHDCTEHTMSSGNSMVEFTLENETYVYQGEKCVYSQINGVITKGVNIGEDRENLISNDSFDNWTGWYKFEDGSDWKIGLTSEIRYRDKNCVDINCCYLTTETYNHIGTELITVSGDTDYTFECFMMTPDSSTIDSGAVIRIIQCYAGGDEIEGASEAVNINFVGNNIFERKEIKVRTRANCSKVKVVIMVYKNGHIYVNSPTLYSEGITKTNVILQYKNEVYNVLSPSGEKIGELAPTEHTHDDYIPKNKIYNNIPVDPELEDDNKSGADCVMSPRSGQKLYNEVLRTLKAYASKTETPEFKNGIKCTTIHGMKDTARVDPRVDETKEKYTEFNDNVLVNKAICADEILCRDAFNADGWGPFAAGVVINSLEFYSRNSNQLSLGTSSNLWSQVYSSTGAIQTSDRNAKDNIENLQNDSRWNELFMKLRPVSFSFKDGTGNRTHVGFISQEIEQAIEECGMTPLEFAGFCKDQKYEIVEEFEEYLVPEDKENGIEEHAEKRKIRKKHMLFDEDGNPEYIYSLRYSEFIALNTMMIQKLQKENEDLKNRIEELENKVNSIIEMY